MPWLVKHDGPCARCGRILVEGSTATWDRSTRTMRCIECPKSDSAEERLLATDGPPIDVGVAGASARREYERRAAKRDAEVRSRWGDRVGGLVLKLTVEPQSTRAWAIGARGEEKLAEELASVEGLQMLHDRRVPGTRGNIDHIAIAPAGVFVVDAKFYDGVIRVRNVGNIFRRDERLYVGSRDCSKLARNMRWQVEAVVTALAHADVNPVPRVVPVLCFVDGDWPRFGAPDAFEGVRLESERSVAKVFNAEVGLDSDAIDRITRVLAAALPTK
jgi:Nuclease-related domain